MVSLIEILSHGGCYWKRERADSPGHSIAIPNGTPFKIKLDGPQSNRVVDGACRDGSFVLAGQAFGSANEAVNAVREPSSNAYLYIEFQIGGRWISADDYRRIERSKLDQAEEHALAEEISVLRQIPKLRGADPAKVRKLAAQRIAADPRKVENARQKPSFDLSEILGL
jgi:hypothetical protein